MLDRADHNRRRIEARRRDRAYRRRVATNRIVAPVEVDAAIADMLVRLGWITEADLGSRNAIGMAITKLLAASARS